MFIIEIPSIYANNEQTESKHTHTQRKHKKFRIKDKAAEAGGLKPCSMILYKPRTGVIVLIVTMGCAPGDENSNFEDFRSKGESERESEPDLSQCKKKRMSVFDL